MKGFLHVVVLGLMLLCSCRSTRSVSLGTELATDTAALVRQQQWQTSVLDSVWRHTELSFDSCFVIFDSGAQATPFIENHVAQPDTSFRADARYGSIRPRAQVVRIYGAHLSSDRKKCTKTEVAWEDTLVGTRKSSLRKAQYTQQTAKPSRFPIKLCLTLVFLAALAAFWWSHRRTSDA